MRGTVTGTPAGAETTYRSSGNLLYLLLTHPEQLAAVQERVEREQLGAATLRGPREYGLIVEAQRAMLRDQAFIGQIAALIRDNKTFRIPNDILTGSKFGLDKPRTLWPWRPSPACCWSPLSRWWTSFCVGSPIAA